MAAKLGGDSDDPISEINVVPLVDIILVVLIIFMVTAPLVLKPTLDVSLPKAASGKDNKPSSLRIGVGAGGALTLNGTAVEMASLGNEVRKIVAQEPDVQAVFEADKTATLERLTPIIDAVSQAGVSKIGFAVERPKPQ